MAMNKNHQVHTDMLAAFEKTDRLAPTNAVGQKSYGFAPSTGLPRTPAQMQSVKKAAKASALARSARAGATDAHNPAQLPGLATGGALGTEKAPTGTARIKKGLLSI
jgi:hypothetical protein